MMMMPPLIITSNGMTAPILNRRVAPGIIIFIRENAPLILMCIILSPTNEATQQGVVIILLATPITAAIAAATTTAATMATSGSPSTIAPPVDGRVGCITNTTGCLGRGMEAHAWRVGGGLGSMTGRGVGRGVVTGVIVIFFFIFRFIVGDGTPAPSIYCCFRG